MRDAERYEEFMERAVRRGIDLAEQLHRETGGDTQLAIYALTIAVQVVHSASPPEMREKIEAQMRRILAQLYKAGPFVVEADGLVHLVAWIKTNP